MNNKKTASEAILITHRDLTSPDYVGVGRYVRPINKYLAVTPELACANRYVGYLAPGEKAS